MRVSRNYMSAMLGIGRNKKTSSKSRMMDRLASTGTNRFANTQKTNKTNNTYSIYQNMKNNAGELQNAASKLTDTGENSLFAKAKESNDTSAVVKQVKEFVSHYNATVRNLRSAGSRVDNSYLNQLNANASMCRNALQAVGVTKNTDGTLSVNDKTLSAASVEQLDKAWGGSTSFAAKTTSAAVNVQSNAVSSMNGLVANSYSNLLNSFGTRGNYFNFWS